LTGLHPSIPVEILVLTPEEIKARLAIGDYRKAYSLILSQSIKSRKNILPK